MDPHTDSPDRKPGDAPGQSSPAERIVARFGGIRPMAQKLGVPVTTVQGWKKRGAIPEQRHPAILDVARAEGIDIDPADLAAAGHHDGGDDIPATAPPAATTRDAGTAAADADADEPPQSPADAARESASGPAGMAARTSAATAAHRAAAAQPPQRRSGAGAAWFAVLVALLALTGAATAPYWIPEVYRQPSPIDLAERMTALEAGGDPQALAAVSDRLAGLGDRLAALERLAADVPSADELAALASRLDAAERAQADAAGLAESLDGLDRRLTALEGGLPSIMAARLAAQDEALERLTGEAGRLSATLADQRATLAGARSAQADLQATAGELDDLTAAMAATQREDGRRIARLEASDSRGQALVLAIGQLRDAVADGGRYAGPLAAVRRLAAGDPRITGDLSRLAATADSGIPTQAMLAADFPAMARAAREAAALPDDPDWLDQAAAAVNNLVSWRPAAGEVEGDEPAAILARAEHRLGAGNLAGAVAAMQKLSGRAEEPAAAWLEEAAARLRAEDALAGLTATAVDRLAALPEDDAP